MLDLGLERTDPRVANHAIKVIAITTLSVHQVGVYAKCPSLCSIAQDKQCGELSPRLEYQASIMEMELCVA